MTRHQELFFIQAVSVLNVFGLLRKHAALADCHKLHCLQMATELLGKAFHWKHEPPPIASHRAFVSFLRTLPKNSKAQKQLGYQGRNEQWGQIIRSACPLAEEIEDLAPALSKDGPNPEYPWPKESPHTAPAEHTFDLWTRLEKTDPGRRFLSFIDELFKRAQEFL